MISIIIPMYNSQKYIKECLDSVIHQKNFNDYEVIVIDDGSTDSSGTICDNYSKNHTQVHVFHTANKGVSSARNYGIKIAKGDFICFVDSDDILLPLFLNNMTNIQKNYEADIVQCNFIEFKKIDVSTPKYLAGTGNCKQVKNREAISEMALEPDFKYGFLWNKLIKKELFLDVKFPDGRICEDEAVTYKLLYKAKKILVTEEILYGYRLSEDSITRKQNVNFKMMGDAIKAIDEAIEYFGNHKEENLKKDFLARKNFLLAKYNIKARAFHQSKELIPSQRMPFLEASRILQNYYGEDFFEYFMYQYYPFYTKIHSKLYNIKCGFKK